MQHLTRPRRHYRRTFYSKLIVSFMVVSTTIILLISSVSHQLFSRQFSDEIAKNHRQRMEYDGNILSAELFQKGYRMFFEVSIQQQYADLFSYFNTRTIANSHVMLLRLYESLQSIRMLSSDLLSEVLVYYPQRGFLVSSRVGYKALDADKNARYASWIDQFPVPVGSQITWWHGEHGQPAAFVDAGGDIVFGGVPNWPGNVRTNRTQLYFFVNSSFVTSLLDNVARGEYVASLLDADGAIILASGNAPPGYAVPAHIWAQAGGYAEQYVSLVDSESPSSEMYTITSIPGSQWKLAMSVPLASYSAQARAITVQMVGLGLLFVLFFLPLTAILSRRLYSPLQQLSALVRQLPNPPEEGLSTNEHDAISASIHRLVSRLGEAQRMLYVERPVIRHMQLQQMLENEWHGSDIYNADSLRVAEISMPESFFAVVLCEWAQADEVRLEAEQQQILRFSLVTHVEEACRAARTHLYGYVADRTHVAWIVNAEGGDTAIFTRIADTSREYLARSAIRSMHAASAWYLQPEDLHLAYEEAKALMVGRFFVPAGVRCIQPAPVAGASVSRAEEWYASALQEGKLPDAIAHLRQLVLIWQTQAPDQAMHSLRHVCNVTALAYSELDPGKQPSQARLLSEPTEALWHASEYPGAMQALMERVMQQEGAGDDLLERTNRYILANLAAPMSLESIASAMHFSPKYFSRMFKEQIGVGLSVHINTLRLQKAAELLIATRLTVEEIAREVGFSSPQYFIRKFKLRYGVTPRQYKQREDDGTAD